MQAVCHTLVAIAWFTTGVAVVASGLVPDVVPVGDEPRRYRLTLSPYLVALVNHAVAMSIRAKWATNCRHSFAPN